MTSVEEDVESTENQHGDHWNGLAIASLVTALLGVPVVSIVLGHVALKRIRSAVTRERGSGLAVAGLVLGYVQLALLVVVVALVMIAANSSDKVSTADQAVPNSAAGKEASRQVVFSSDQIAATPLVSDSASGRLASWPEALAAIETTYDVEMVSPRDDAESASGNIFDYRCDSGFGVQPRVANRVTFASSDGYDWGNVEVAFFPTEADARAYFDELTATLESIVPGTKCIIANGWGFHFLYDDVSFNQTRLEGRGADDLTQFGGVGSVVVPGPPEPYAVGYVIHVSSNVVIKVEEDFHYYGDDGGVDGGGADKVISDVLTTMWAA